MKFCSSPRLSRLALFLAVVVAGCASASVTPEKVATPSRPGPPQQIVVRNFATVAEDVKESHGVISQTERKFSNTPEEQRQMDIAHAAAQELSDQLVKDLKALGFTNVVEEGQASVGSDALVIEGQFINVDEGAATRRIIVGFGVGKSTVDTQVQVYRVSGGSRQKVLEFTTHSDSGKLPGTALTMGAGAVATGGATAAGATAASGVSGAKAYLGRVTYLAHKTADQVNAYLSHYFAEQGWISADKAQGQDVNLAPKSATPSGSGGTM
jgi:hypothetical protein